MRQDLETVSVAEVVREAVAVVWESTTVDERAVDDWGSVPRGIVSVSDKELFSSFLILNLFAENENGQNDQDKEALQSFQIIADYQQMPTRRISRECHIKNWPQWK